MSKLKPLSSEQGNSSSLALLVERFNLLVPLSKVKSKPPSTAKIAEMPSNTFNCIEVLSEAVFFLTVAIV